MPTFCRHNRFIERCPICSKTLPGRSPSGRSPRGTARGRATGSDASRRHGVRREGVRVQREGRAGDDGYRSALVPGLRASADATRLVEEIAFSSGRLLALAAAPPGLYGEIRALAAEDKGAATWACFLTAYLSPLEGEDPFAGIRMVLSGAPDPVSGSGEEGDAGADGLPDLSEVPLGPRTSHDPARGAETLIAYRQWVRRAGSPGASSAASSVGDGAAGGGSQELAFAGDPGWSPERRFERLFERLALPGFARIGRYDLLVTLGRLGLYELRASSLYLGGARGLSADDPTTLAAKRVFGIGDPLLLERRAAALAEAASVPVEALDLALANWAAAQRATLGLAPDTLDPDAFERAGEALGL